MAYVWADRVLETSTTTGTGALALAGAVTKNRTFASVCSVADTLPYAIVNLDANEWEVGLGTYSAANQLTRTTVQASSNGGAAVNFSAGTKRVGLATTAGSLVPSTGGTMTGALTINVTGTNVLAVRGDGAVRCDVTRYSTDNNGPSFLGNKARGTFAAPTVPATSDDCFTLVGQLYDGVSAFRQAGVLRFTALSTPSPTNAEASFSVWVSANGAITATEILRAEHTNGLSMFGANTVIDADRLFRLRQYTVATLPTVGTAGRLAAVTDATAPTYNGALTGGGAVNVPVYDNGAAWVSH